MVSPVFKGGFGAPEINAVSADGNAVGYYSPGAFNGAPSGPELSLNYLARRGAAGWSSVPLMVPTSLLPEHLERDMSPGLDLMLATGRPGPNSQNSLLTKLSFLLHPTSIPDDAAGWDVLAELEDVNKVAPVQINYLQASIDFCHIVLRANNTVLAPEGAAFTNNQLYEVDRGCDGKPSGVALVGLNNNGKLISRNCRAGLGTGGYAPTENDFNAVSAGGGEVFFTDLVGSSRCDVENSGIGHQLFVRLGGSRTVEVSRPLETGKPFGGCVGEGIAGEVPCEGASARASADFVGASRDGSRVYFTTAAQLTGTDTDGSRDLYMATIGCPPGKSACGVAERQVVSLTQVSHDPNGAAAEVQGVVRVAPDGSRAYFVASGDLLSSAQRLALEGEGRPVPHAGAANLYVYDSGSAVPIAFVGDLCTGREASGTVEAIRCPSEKTDAQLWTKNGSEGFESQTAGSDGRFFVFASFAQLTGSDTNVVKDVYRYDATTGRLDRVSHGEGGYGADGNVGSHGSSITLGHGGGVVLEEYELDSRAISEDGSHIVFRSADPLSPAATNGLVNAYEWHATPDGSEGTVSLVSPGNDRQPINSLVISATGTDVFFVTASGLVPQDTDNAVDVYDARLDGGLPQGPTEQRPCEGDACQGPLTNPAPLLVPGSVSQAPADNLAAAPLAPGAKPAPLTSAQRLARALRACRKVKKSTGRHSCERQARRRFGSAKARRTVNRRRAPR
jgi:hypothetical protein